MSTRLLRILARLLLVGAAALALALTVGSGSRPRFHLIGTPLPSPIYDVETFSLGQHLHHPAVVGVPTPIDVDGDLLPDVNVTVNVVNLEGISNPPVLNNIVRATLTINRDPTAVALGRPAPPLKALANFTLLDSATLKPAEQLGLGYDTGPGGSIPPHWDASIGGFQTLFSTLDASVDTMGGISGLTTNPLTKPATYLGPLSLVANVGLPGVSSTNLAFRYQPFPGQVRFTYSSDGTGNHIHYLAPTTAPASHLLANVQTSGVGSATTMFNGDVDPLPSDLQADFQTSGTDGHVDLTQHSSGRHPDVGFQFLTVPPSGAPLSVNGSVSSLPTTLHGQWSLVPGSPAASFDASGQGVGGVDLDVRNFQGAPQVLKPFIPSERQFANYQSMPGGANGTETEISAHAELIRHLDFARTADGFSAHAGIGDGEMPLQVHFQKDDRSGANGSYINATGTVSPLPAQLGATLHTSTNPKTIELITDTNQTADIDGHVEFSPGQAGTGCGSNGTICGDVKVRHAPTHVDVTAGNVDDVGQGLNVDDTPATGSQPDITADVNIGPGTLAIPANATTPLVGHVQLFGLPPHLRARMHTDQAGNMDRAEFHACDWDFAATPPACKTPGPVPSIAQLAFSLRNFTDATRPNNLQPVVPTQPQFASIVSRQAANAPLLFEATGQLARISEIDVRNVNGVLGVRSVVGGGQKLAAHVDIDDPTQSLLTDATVDPLPPTLDFCLRRAKTAPGTTTGAPYTVVCEDANPFGLASAPPITPTSLWFNAPGTPTFGLDASAQFVSKGATPAGTEVYRAALKTATIPQSLTAHVSTVKCSANPATAEACPPLRALYQLPANSPQIDMAVSAQISTADSGCADPRVTATSTCFSGQLQHLPTRVSLCYDANNLHTCDPADTSRNLFVNSTSSAQPFNLLNFNLTSVAPKDKVPPSYTSPGANIMVVSGQILGVPLSISGFLGQKGFDLKASPPIGEVDATMRNYLGPDPLASIAIPTQRSTRNAPSSTFAAFQRGEFLKVTAGVKTVSAVGYHQSVKIDPVTQQEIPLKTKVISVGFDPGKTIRGYADIIDGSDGSQTVADATIDNNPAAVSICVRSKDPDARKAANPSPWCDTNSPNPDKLGAFEVAQTAAGSGAPPDVHAFLRTAEVNNNNPVDAVVDLTGIPPIVHGSIGNHDSKTYEVSGLQSDGATLAGIGRIQVDVASFDFPLSSIGYNGPSLPAYVPGALPPTPAPLPVLSGQSLAAAIADNGFHAIANLGGPSGAHLQHLLLTDVACAKPDANRDDFPYYPQPGNGITYTCVRTDFTKDPGTGATPLALSAQIDNTGKHLKLSNAGLTDIPSWVQATLSDLPSASTDNTTGRRCAASSVNLLSGYREINGGDGKCLPPMVRFDATASNSPPNVYGSLELYGAGGPAELDTLKKQLQPEPAPGAASQKLVDGAGHPIDLGADPVQGWNGETGIRLKIGAFPQSNSSDDTAIVAGVILPLPGSLSIDPMQSFNDTSSTNGPNGKPSYKVSERRVHFVARNYPTSAPHGQVLADLGNLAAMDVQYQGSPAVPGTEILAQNKQGAGGTRIPGEIGLNLYDHAEDFQPSPPPPPPGLADPRPGDTKELFQLELFLSKSLSLVLHVNNLNETIGNLDATISNIPAVSASDPANYICNARGVAACHPGATVRTELVKGPSCPLTGNLCKPPEPPKPPNGDEPDVPTITPNPVGGTLCTVEKQSADQPCIHIAQITLSLDFMQNIPETRLVDAVIHLDGAKAGLEIAGNTNNINPTLGQPAKFLADGEIFIDQLAMHFQDKIATPDPLPPLMVFMDLQSMVHIEFHAGTDSTVNPPQRPGATDFQIQSDILHLSGSSTGGPSTVGPLNMVMKLFSASAHLGVLGELVNISYDPGGSSAAPLNLGFWDFNKGVPTLNISIPYPDCCPPAIKTATIASLPLEPQTLDIANGNAINLPANGSFNAGIDPLDDSRVHVHVIVKLPVQGLIVGILGKTASKQALGLNLGDGGYPSDPVDYPGHRLTDIANGATALDGLGNTTVPQASPPPRDKTPAGGGGGTVGTADITPPTSVLLTAPGAPAGGIYLSQPYAVILAADNPGGSGIKEVHYHIDAMADTLFTVPFVIPPGTHTICYHAVDNATPTNLIEAEVSPNHPCATVVVDDAAPALSVTPPPNTNPSGWFTSSPTVTVSAVDTNSDGSAGSGVTGIFTSLDGATPFNQTPGSQSITIPVGVHQLRVYATDVAGHHSQVQFLTYQVDQTGPVSSVRTFAPTSAQNGWWRSNPLIYLRSVDGDQSSGVQTLQYRFDSVGPYLGYNGPFSVPSGVHTVAFQGIDIAGNVEPTQSTTLPVDVTPPTATALAPSPLIFIPLFGPAHINWQAGDDLSGTVHVQVFVYSATGDVARHLDAGTVTVTPGSVVNGSTNWDGRDDTLTGVVPLGLYTYRVLVTDQAGNTAQSADSIPIQLKLL